jgi:hypothetical protein
MKYTFSDDEDDIYSDSTTTRRSTRNTGTHTPAEPAAPTVTLSGRQVKARQGGAYGESMLSGQVAVADDTIGTSAEPEDDVTDGRPRRAAATNGWSKPGKGGRHIEGYNNVDEMSSDEEGDASEQDYGDDEEEDDHVSLASDVEEPDDESEEDAEMIDDVEKESLVVKLPVKTPTPERERKLNIKFNVSPGKVSQPDFKKDIAPATTNGTSLAKAEPPSKPVDIPEPTAPHSPLTLRGSPKKGPTFPPQPINVGYEGS